jgi:hypothetical protein
MQQRQCQWPSRIAAVLVLVISGAMPAQAQQACAPLGMDRKALADFRVRKFEVADDATRARLATALLPCLGNADPVLRDETAFAAYSSWMRARLLPVAMLRSLRDALYTMLDGEDAQGFRRPFAALTLAEIARTDRIDAWMSDAERDAMVRRANAYLASVRDYRGFDQRAGWRHGVAHGSDWLMQLTLNAALTRAQLDAVLVAIAAQVAPASGHAYVFGEPERLVRPVLYVARRGLLGEADWNAWLAALVAQLGDGARAFKDSVWLARRHDLYAFLSELYINTDLAEEAPLRALQPSVLKALRQLP